MNKSLYCSIMKSICRIAIIFAIAAGLPSSVPAQSDSTILHGMVMHDHASTNNAFTLVALNASTFTMITSTQSDSNGNFNLAVQPDSAFYLQIMHSEYPNQFYGVRGTTDGPLTKFMLYRGEFKSIIIDMRLTPANDTIQSAPPTTSAYSSIYGGVKDSMGTSWRNVPVSLLGAAGEVVAVAVTDGKGNFIFDSLVSRMYNFKVEAGGYPVQYWNSWGMSTTPSPAGSFYLSPGTSFPLNVILSAKPATTDTITAPRPDTGMSTGYIIGQLFDSLNMPLPGGTVQLVGPSGEIIAETPVNTWGTFFMPAPLRSMYLAVQRPPFPRQFYNKTGTSLNSSTMGMFYPLAYDTTSFTITLRNNPPLYATDDSTGHPVDTNRYYGAITGQVFDTTGNSVGGAAIKLIDPANLSIVRQTMSDSSGLYFFPSLVARPYYLAVDLKPYPYQFWSYDGTTKSTSSADMISLMSSDTMYIGITVRLNPSADTGSYIPPDTTRNYASASISGTVRAKTGGTQLSGILVSCIQSWEISYWNNQSRTQHETITKSDGSYRFDSLPAGQYYIAVRSDSLNYISQYFNHSDLTTTASATYLTAGQSQTAIDFELRSGAIVSGKVMLADGTPIAYATVMYWDQNGRNPFTATTNALGLYTLRGLPAGTWHGQVWSTAYLMARNIPMPSFTCAETQTLTNQNLTMERAGYVAGTYSPAYSDSSVFNSYTPLYLYADSQAYTSQSVLMPSFWGSLQTNAAQKTFASDGCPVGKWRAVFGGQTYLPMQGGGTSSGTYGTVYIPDTARFALSNSWGYLGNPNALFESMLPITVLQGDTVRNQQMVQRRGYTIYGELTTDDAMTPQNVRVRLFAKTSTHFIMVTEGYNTYSSSNRRFAIGGLIDGQDYYLQASANGYPEQFLSSTGNAVNPKEAYRFTTTAYSAPKIRLLKSPAGFSNTPGGPGGTGTQGTGPLQCSFSYDSTLTLNINWSASSSITVDSFILYSLNKFQMLSRLIAVASKSASPYSWRETRPLLDSQYSYCVVGKSSTRVVRSNTIVFDQRETRILPTDSLWLDVFNRNSSVTILWGAGKSYQNSANTDSVTLYRRVGTELWKVVEKSQAWRKEFTDYSWSRSTDSGKTFQYKVELQVPGKTLRLSSPSSFMITSALFNNPSTTLMVGTTSPYTTIQAAIDAAKSGDYIRVQSGTYPGALNFRGKSLTLDADWQTGKPPVIDGQGAAAAITITAVTPTMGGYSSMRISGFKIINAQSAIKTAASCEINQCLFYAVNKAVDAAIDSVAMVNALIANPFLSNRNNVYINGCTMVGKPGALIAAATAVGTAEKSSDTSTFVDQSTIYPPSSLSWNINTYNSIFSGFAGTVLPVSIAGKSPWFWFNSCDFWLTSKAIATAGNFNISAPTFALDPRFTDTTWYFQSDSSTLLRSGSNGSAIGYDGRRMSTQQSQTSSLRAVSNVKVTPQSGSFMISWDALPAASGVYDYLVYRLKNPLSSTFKANALNQWEPVNGDSLQKVLDTASTTKTYVIDSTAAMGASYMFIVVARDAQGRQGQINVSAANPIASLCYRLPYSQMLQSNQWYMLGIPASKPVMFTLPTGTTGATNSSIYYWNDTRTPSKLLTQYDTTTTLNPLQGYWVRSASVTTLGIDSTALAPNGVMGDSVPLRFVKGVTGWNQIASPYPFAITPSWLATYRIYEWDSYNKRYTMATQLKPWRGYWVHTDRDTTVQLLGKPAQNTQKAFAKMLAQARWEVRLELTGRQGSDPDNIMGVLPPSLAKSAATVSGLEPPPAFDAPQLFFVDSLSTGLPQRYTVLYKAAAAQNRLEWTVGISAHSEALTITVHDLASVPADLGLYWVSAQTIVDLRQNSSVSLPACAKTSYGYVVATGNKNEIALYRGTVELRRSYPNPFGKTTTLEFVLPCQWNSDGTQAGNGMQQVSLALYNTAGRQVTTIVNGQQKFGIYRVVWNGTNNHGTAVPTGMYIARLSTPSAAKSVLITYMP